MASSAVSVSQRSSSTVIHTTKPTWTTNVVTVVEKIPTSTTTVLQTVFQYSASTTTISEEVFTTTLAAVSSSDDYYNSISDAQVFQQSTSSSLSSTMLISPLPIETTKSLPFTISDPTLTTSGIFVTTFLTASTDSLGVHTYTKTTTIAKFQAGGPSSTPQKDLHRSEDGSPLNIPMTILIVLGIVAACALTLLFIWWWRGRRREARHKHIYPFSEGVESPAWKQRGFDKRPYFGVPSDPQHAINRSNDSPFGNNHVRGTSTLTPFLEQTGTEVLVIGNPGVSSPHVRFEKHLGGSERGSEDRTPRRTKEGTGTTQRDRPPTYYTNSTGLATIATTLPLYSAVDPSPISERSDISTTPTTSTPKSPFLGRRTRPPRFSPRTPFGKKF